MATVYLGIGSNLGDRQNYIEQAVKRLGEIGINVVKQSSLIETEPVGGPPNQGKYLNGVLKSETNLAPIELLRQLKQIESQLDRVTTVTNGPRTIDIDILLYDQLFIQTPELTIPHPRMFSRDFVINPLKEIEPQLAEEMCHAHHQKN